MANQPLDDDKTIVADSPTVVSPDPRFKMLRCLGSGGMGDVHLAEDSALRRKVAIKTIRADLCKNEEIRKRIERECLLHAKIGSHPHIVTLFDRIEHGGQINLVMEFVEGQTLQDLLTGGGPGGRPLSWKDGINIAAQTLEALGRIHAQGIVHRDIKPANIIVTRDDAGAYCAKLMDFGIARMQTEDEQSTMLTKDGTGGPGTPTYMAPEQIDPRTFGPISTATDVYAMGVMLYQILSGRPPFMGSLTEVFNGHLNRQPPGIDFHGDASVPPEIKEILECALAKKPSQRFPSVKVFREELLRVARGGLTGAAGTVAGGPGEDTNRTLVASSAAVASPPGGHGATMLDTTGARRGGRGGIVKVLAVVAALLVAAGAVAAWFVFSGGETGETAPPANEVATQDAQPEPEAAPPADGAATIPAPDALAAPVAAPDQPAASAGPALPAAVPATPAALPPAPSASPIEPVDTSTKSDAMQALMKKLDESPPAAEPASPAAESKPAAKQEPPKPKPGPPKPEPQEKAPEPVQAKPEPKPADPPAEPDKPAAGSGWTVKRVEDRKIE